MLDAPGGSCDQESMAEEREYSEEGIDLSLIRWMLSLSPAERLQALEQHVQAVLEIRARNEKILPRNIENPGVTRG